MIKSLQVFEQNSTFVLKVLPVICFLCSRGSDKAAISADNLLAFGLAGAAKVVVNLLNKYSDNEMIITWTCSAIRHLATLHSNKSRLGAAGACTAVVKLIKMNNNMETLPKYAFRAIGHLANDHEKNREMFINLRFCEVVVSVVQKYIHSHPSVVEGCYAIRKLAVSPQALTEMIGCQLGELIGALLTKYSDDDVLSVEVMRVVVVACQTLSTHEVLIPRQYLAMDNTSGTPRRPPVSFAFNGRPNSTGPAPGHNFSDNSNREKASIVRGEHVYVAKLQTTILRSLTRAMGKKGKSSKTLLLLQWCCRVVVAMATEADNIKRFAENRVCELIIWLLHTHNDPLLIEWCCKAVVAMNKLDGINGKFRGMGGCELVVIAMQQLCKVPSAVEAAAVAVSSFAQEVLSSQKLGQTGGCDAAVIALSRYVYNGDVAHRLLDCIHSLALQSNNRAWLGAAGACELVVKATRAHINNEDVASAGCRAFGSLSMVHPKNIQRLRQAHAAECTIAALTSHKSLMMTVDASRTIANMGVGCELFGACGACEAVVSALVMHSHLKKATIGVCDAIGALIGLENNVNGANASKLIAAGANEAVISALKTHTNDGATCVAICGAIAQLAFGTEGNKVALGSLDACELLELTLRRHAGDVSVIRAVAVAVEKLTRRNIENKRRCGVAGVCELLMGSLETHNDDEDLIALIYKALVSLFYYTDNRSRCSTPEFCRVITRPLRRLKHNRNIAASGSMALTTLIYDDATANLLGLCKAPEAVVKAILRHADDAEVAEWGCYALWKLTTQDSNKQVLSNVECCELILSILRLHRDNAKVNEWAIKLMMHLSMYDHTANGSADEMSAVGISESFSGRQDLDTIGSRNRSNSNEPPNNPATDTFMHTMMKAHRRGSSTGAYSLSTGDAYARHIRAAEPSSATASDLFSTSKNSESNRSKFISNGAVELLVGVVSRFSNVPAMAKYVLQNVLFVSYV